VIEKIKRFLQDTQGIIALAKGTALDVALFILLLIVLCKVIWGELFPQ
jgi:hypothetical protein